MFWFRKKTMTDWLGQTVEVRRIHGGGYVGITKQGTATASHCSLESLQLALMTMEEPYTFHVDDFDYAADQRFRTDGVLSTFTSEGSP